MAVVNVRSTPYTVAAGGSLLDPRATALVLERLRTGDEPPDPRYESLSPQEQRETIILNAKNLLDVDGEQPGRLPATFEVLPGALRLQV